VLSAIRDRVRTLLGGNRLPPVAPPAPPAAAAH
jgi:hypothetical protein